MERFTQGEDAVAHSMPSMAHIRFRSPIVYRDDLILCGGVLIDSQTVMTAAS